MDDDFFDFPTKSITISYDLDSFYKYAAGYLDAGLILINNLLDMNRYSELSNLDDNFRIESIRLEEESHIYPAMFLFRQYLELMIKALYLEFELDGLEKALSNHKLSEIWYTLKDKLLELEKDNDELDGSTCILDDLITEFSQIDDKSYCFRYPVDTKGIPFFKVDKSYDLYEIRSKILEFDSLIHEFL